MLIRSFRPPCGPTGDRHALSLEPCPGRPLLFSQPNRGPVRPASPRTPRVLSNPFSYPDPLSDLQEDPISRRVQEIRRLQTGTIAFETRRRRQNISTDPGPQIRPLSAVGQRQPPQTRPGAPSRAKGARPNSARPRRKPPVPVSPLKRITRPNT